MRSDEKGGVGGGVLEAQLGEEWTKRNFALVPNKIL